MGDDHDRHRQELKHRVDGPDEVVSKVAQDCQDDQANDPVDDHLAQGQWALGIAARIAALLRGFPGSRWKSLAVDRAGYRFNAGGNGPIAIAGLNSRRDDFIDNAAGERVGNLAFESVPDLDPQLSNC